MVDTTNPYASTATGTGTQADDQLDQPKSLWIGLLIAPAIAPSIAAAAIFWGGPYLVDPDDTGTPIGIVLLPILFLTVGMIASYLLTLAIGMPIAFFLQRRRMLGAITIHAAAIGISITFALLVVFVSVSTWWFGTAPPPPDFSSMLMGFGALTLGSGLFVIPTATVFWMVVCVLGRRQVSTDDSPDLSVRK